MFVMALHGPRGAGKDTVAERLVTHHGFEQLAFADPIRAMVMAAFDLPESALLDPREKESPHPALLGLTPRQALQRLGEGACQSFGERVWVERLHRRAVTLRDGGCQRLVISDLRKPIELDYVRGWPANRVIGLMRPGTHFLNDHATEVGLELRHIDRWILNDRGPGELIDRVDYLIEELIG